MTREQIKLAIYDKCTNDYSMTAQGDSFSSEWISTATGLTTAGIPLPSIDKEVMGPLALNIEEP
jgi:hypothetical protein